MRKLLQLELRIQKTNKLYGLIHKSKKLFCRRAKCIRRNYNLWVSNSQLFHSSAILNIFQGHEFSSAASSSPNGEIVLNGKPYTYHVQRKCQFLNMVEHYCTPKCRCPIKRPLLLDTKFISLLKLFSLLLFLQYTIVHII